MSGKGEGKKRNRAAQSEQHGYQEPAPDHAAKPGAGEAAGAETNAGGEKQRVLDQLRELERRRRDRESSGG